jgi:hypothetical protein
MKYIISIIFFFVLLHSCQKDDDSLMQLCEIISPCVQQTAHIPFQDTCYDLPPAPFPTWIPIRDTYQYLPVINPLNKDEMMYFVTDSSGDYLLKVDLCTDERVLVYSELKITGLGIPKWWGDWLVFTGSEGSVDNLWKIKSNGDSLQQITNFPSTTVYNPSWINEGSQILAYTALYGSASGRNYIFTPDGEIVDSLDVLIGKSNYWSGRMATFWNMDGLGHIGYYDLLTKELHPTPSFTLTSNPASIDWIDENNIMLLDEEDLSRINIQTGEVMVLKENCENRWVQYATTSPAHEGMIYFSEVHTTIVDSLTARYKSRIYKIDAFTGEEWLVDL